MILLLLVCTAVLTTIFGITHSRRAREILYLQTFYECFAENIKSCLRYVGFHTNRRNSSIDDEISDQDDIVETVPRFINSESCETTEEFRGIKVEEIDLHETCDSSLTPQEQKDNVEDTLFEDPEGIIASINASLQKLSTTANSIEVNGTKLYSLLFREMLVHCKATLSQNNSQSASMDEPSSEASIEIKEIDAEMGPETQKQNMYFGNPPMDYVPHQK